MLCYISRHHLTKFHDFGGRLTGRKRKIAIHILAFVGCITKLLNLAKVLQAYVRIAMAFTKRGQCGDGSRAGPP